MRTRFIASTAMLATAVAACDNGPKVGPPERITKQGNAQVGQVGAALPNPVSLTIQDADGHGVPGITVTFAVTSGAGSIQNASGITDGDGTALAGTWTLGTVTGTQSLTATAAGVPGSPAFFTATANAGPTATLTKVSADPVSAPAGGNIDSIAVRALDAFGNAVAGQQVSFAVTAGDGSVSPTSQTTLADGRAAARWTIGATVGATNTARASLPDGSRAITFSTMAVVPVAAVRFPQAVFVVDSGASQPLATRAVDANGAEIAGAEVVHAARNPSVASAGASVTGLRSGQTFVVGTSADNPAVRDSALLIVAGAGKPAVFVTMPRFDLKADTTFTVSIMIDSRSSAVPVGATTLQVRWSTAALSFVGEQAGSASAVVDVNTTSAANGSVTIAMASANGLVGAVEIRRITLKASAVAGRAGSIAVDVVEMSAAGTFANLAGQTVSGTYPIRIR